MDSGDSNSILQPWEASALPISAALSQVFVENLEPFLGIMRTMHYLMVQFRNSFVLKVNLYHGLKPTSQISKKW